MVSFRFDVLKTGIGRLPLSTFRKLTHLHPSEQYQGINPELIKKSYLLTFKDKLANDAMAWRKT